MTKTSKNVPKLRTVTEIITGKDKLKRDYDLTEFDVKNLNSLHSFNTIQIINVICHYMGTLNTLNLTQPLLTIFRDHNAQREIVSIVLTSLGFVHHRVNPLVNNFSNRMEFIVVENQNVSVPGEPIVFRLNENDDIVCMIDRLSILKSLARESDINVCVDDMIKEKNEIKIMKAFSGTGSKRRMSGTYEINSGIQLNEDDVTRYLSLLFIIEHAYCHYCILKNHGAFSYIKSIINHSLFATKCRPNSNLNLDNLLLSKFRFSIEQSDSYKLTGSSGGGNKFLGILNCN
ncbi:occlusion derived viral protein-e27 [Ectropis obliqua nucleopolyhedrovirus]|uniref:Occlusion derived viral protein-e27 n=1 Tax=Ectropis obliqua nucleopolyhedrovirus TaxID=59376 RepID=A0EYR2_9ABAC|nr:occlusion derived viral protein-e27 [Ectropis obliqua nucleopolyhedrovirus]ABI35693.1 occlusion derived viral protein-e27 [Ectropis obliqua nucleopolyhedrovirus]AGS47875.1 occlusion-derived virus envelope protein E27 [Ectropis obliqua nucleopolyhedrovirus]QWV59595.1 occlusion derived viral protein-e27 [Ectropis obliqua nucleopolyhedrovirus]UYO72801.1 occlusion derived viral protein-e27 [Ectropis obliqua nucleopolyhedrovirus]